MKRIAKRGNAEIPLHDAIDETLHMSISLSIYVYDVRKVLLPESRYVS